MTASERERRAALVGPRLLEVAHVAHRLSVSAECVRILLRTGQLPAVRLGTHYRIDPKDLDAYIEKRRTMQRIRSILSTGGSA